MVFRNLVNVGLPQSNIGALRPSSFPVKGPGSYGRILVSNLLCGLGNIHGRTILLVRVDIFWNTVIYGLRIITSTANFFHAVTGALSLIRWRRSKTLLDQKNKFLSSLSTKIALQLRQGTRSLYLVFLTSSLELSTQFFLHPAWPGRRYQFRGLKSSLSVARFSMLGAKGGLLFAHFIIKLSHLLFLTVILCFT